MELQTLPIGFPNAILKRQFRKKKTHSLTNARGLNGAEIATLNLRTRETRNTRVRKERTTVTPSDDEDDDNNQNNASDENDDSDEDDDNDEDNDNDDNNGNDEDEEGMTTVLNTPPRPITLAIKSPEAPPPPSRAPSPPELMTASRSFPEGPFVPPASTAPPRLADDKGRPKRKRAPTQGRYKDAVAQGKVSKP